MDDTFILYEQSMKEINRILEHPELSGDSKEEMIRIVVDDLNDILILLAEREL